MNLDNISKRIEELANVQTVQNPDLDKLLIESSIKVTDNIPPIEHCLKVVNNDDSLSNISSYGNFSLIIGKAKSKKSFFVALSITAFLKNDIIINKLKGDIKDNRNKVLFFDTEQSKTHVHKSLKRISNLLNIPDLDNIETFCLRKYEPYQRLEMIEYKLYNTPNIGLVVIDGIKDLVNSINSEEEATKISSKLLKWSEELNIHIMTVLHQNKGDANARGHLGTELVNKAETTLSITKSTDDKSISIVESEYCREMDIDTFAFMIEDNLPVLAEQWKPKSNNRKESISFDDIGEINIKSVLNECFSHQSEYGYSKLVSALKVLLKSKLKLSMGDNKVKDLISHCKLKNWISQEKDKSPYRLSV